MSGKAKSLLKSYLQSRYQRALITNSLFNSNTVSKWIKITCGVPQGSILGPLLFLLYINDLPKAIKHKALPILFADDTSILITNPNSNQLQSELNTVFAQLNKWFKSNLLFLNFDKTHFIQFNNASKCNSVTEIKYKEEQISIAEEQFGFRADSTTSNAIYKLINETLNALNSELIVGGIFFFFKS